MTSLPVGAHAFVVADQDLRDRYGRYLLYLWRAHGLFVNEAIVTTGHGRAVLYEPNDAYIGRIRAADAAAQLPGVGGRLEEWSRVVDRVSLTDHAATSVAACPGRSTRTPFSNWAPARTSATRCAPLT